MTIELIKRGKIVNVFGINIKITRDKKEVFSSSEITGWMFRRSIYLKEKQENSTLDTSLLDEIGQFVCEVFNNQFTLQELYDGLEVNEILETFNNVLMKVIRATVYYQKH